MRNDFGEDVVRDIMRRVPASLKKDGVPCAVLAHHYPDVPNLGDMSRIDGERYYGAVDLIIGGTFCEDFSIAGKRAGMAGERGGLPCNSVVNVASNATFNIR